MTTEEFKAIEAAEVAVKNGTATIEQCNLVADDILEQIITDLACSGNLSYPIDEDLLKIVQEKTGRDIFKEAYA